jgi:hypothetical protein
MIVKSIYGFRLRIPDQSTLLFLCSIILTNFLSLSMHILDAYSDDTGVIHIESPEDRNFTIGESFDIWGQNLR